MNRFIYDLQFVILIFACYQLSPANGFSQNIKGGAIFGFNATQVDGDERAGYHKVGFNTGGIAIVPVKKKLSVSMEILYSERGSRSSAGEIEAYGYDYRLKLNYVEVPFLLNYQDKEKVNFGIGASVGTLVKFIEYQDDRPIPDTSKPYYKRDYSFVANGNYLLSSHWAINLRYSYSMRFIAIRLMSRGAHKQWHNVVSVRVIYLF